jgi:hypothetical protein
MKCPSLSAPIIPGTRSYNDADHPAGNANAWPLVKTVEAMEEGEMLICREEVAKSWTKQSFAELLPCTGAEWIRSTPGLGAEDVVNRFILGAEAGDGERILHMCVV